MKVLLVEVAKSSSAFRALASSPIRWISITLPILDTTELDDVREYEVAGAKEASLVMVRPGRYMESTSITSENVSESISVPRFNAYEISCGDVESFVMLVITTASEGCCTVLPNTSTTEPLSSTINVFCSVVAKSVKLLSPFKSS